MDPDRLRAIPVFSSLDDERLKEVATFATELSVSAGTCVVKEGDYAYDFMAIEEGEADVIRADEKLATLGPGDFFGEIALLEKSLRHASVVATTPMRLIRLTHWDLRRVGGALDEIRRTLEERKRTLG